jgi:bacteriocin biosynthesis cyclodehydratase domain-containing protein
VGDVDVRDGGVVEPWDVSPGGLPPASVGERRSDAARRAVRGAAPERGRAAGGEPDAAGQGLSLVVLAPRDGLGAHAPDPGAAADLITSGIPHLYAGVVEATGVVGPLVLPGSTPCAGCLAQARTDRDAAWPRLMAQWCSGRQRQVVAGDTALTASAAALAAAHALAFLDGGLPASAGARCELAAPSLDWRTVPLAAHPRCPCGAGRPVSHPPAAPLPGETGPEASAQETPRRHGTRQHGTHRSRRQAARDNGPVPAARGTAVRARPGNGGAHV